MNIMPAFHNYITNKHNAKYFLKQRSDKMSVTTRATKVSYEYKQGTAYSLPFEYQSPSDVKASYIDSVGSEVSLDYNADYTVSGSTVKVTAVLPDGVTITFARRTEITQQMELPPQTITKAIETAIDRNTLCIQELDTITTDLGEKLESDITQMAGKVDTALSEVEGITSAAVDEMNGIKDETLEIAQNVNVFVPSVTENILSWTNKAGLPNPDPVNIKGEQGKHGTDGANGKDGAAATVAIGTVTTGEPGTTASVTNVGTDTAAVLDITIPRGDKGTDGTGAGDVVAAADNTFTATNTFNGVLKTKSDMQAVGALPTVLQRGDSNIQTYTLNNGLNRSVVFRDTGDMTGYAKTFIISVSRSGGTGTFSIGSNNGIGANTPTVYMMDGALPDIDDGEVLKIAMEVNEPANAIFIYILGKVAL
jgi:hypothetical protein